jgi:hypothetical protein
VHIYTDESGGADKRFFVCAAVRVDHTRAARILKRMKKAVRVNGELHAMNLKTPDLLKVMDVLTEDADIMAVAIFCGSGRPVDHWAMGAMKEHDLWRELLTEALMPLVSSKVTHIIADRPKYKATVQSAISTRVSADLARRKLNNAIPVNFRDSEEVAGIQIADTISHCVYRSLMPQDDAKSIEAVLKQMTLNGQLVMQPVELLETRPRYLTISADMLENVPP